MWPTALSQLLWYILWIYIYINIRKDIKNVCGSHTRVCVCLLHGGVLNRLAHSHSGDQIPGPHNVLLEIGSGGVADMPSAVFFFIPSMNKNRISVCVSVCGSAALQRPCSLAAELQLYTHIWRNIWRYTHYQLLMGKSLNQITKNNFKNVLSR